MMPLSISSTLAVLPSGTNIADVRDGAPPVLQAYSLIMTSVSGVISPARKALNIMMSSISLLMLAGGTSSSALRWKRMPPESASIRMRLRGLDDDLAALCTQ